MRLFCFGILIWTATANIWGQSHLLSPSEFEVLLGDLWVGNLTYLDYQSGEEVKIRAELQIQKTSESEYRFIYSYPDEPKANSKQKLRIGKNHMTINKHRITSRAKGKDGLLLIETKHVGKDDRKSANIYTQYRIHSNSFSLAKYVEYQDQEEKILRSKYTFLRESQ